MNFKKTLSYSIATSVMVLAIINSAFAADMKVIRASVLDFENIEEGEFAAADAVEIEKIENKVSENCSYESPEKKSYDSQVITVRRQLRVETGETFRVKVFLKNTGNIPWFSGKSTCNGPHMSLGTDKGRDRTSSLFTEKIDGVDNTNWESKNRIGMDQLRVEPGEIASFTFWSKAPNKPDVFKEYFTPIIEAVQWNEDSQFSFELMVGETDQTAVDMRTRLFYANASGSVMDIPLKGEKWVLVDISEQRLELHLDDYIVREFPISSGAYATPTPYGETRIELKQEVRVGGKSPHYIMPKFMWFRSGGYGFHALPSLGTDGGIFWTEALNHIGRPVSHGCVRLLPWDADFMFDFVEIGSRVVVQP